MSEEQKYIPMTECVDRGVYRIASRNLGVGVFRAENNGFIGIRFKFGDRYLFTEFHWDTGAPFGTVKPIEQIGVLPDDIVCSELITHKYGGQSFAVDPVTGTEQEVVRRDLAEGEAPHGERIGFVDEWGDTRERVPDNVWTYVKENQELFAFLENLEKSNASRTDHANQRSN